MEITPTTERGWLFSTLAAVILTVQAYVITVSIPGLSATQNEASHIVSGLAYWINGDFRLFNVNPPLPRLVATAPLLCEAHLCMDAARAYDGRDISRQEFCLGDFFADTNALWFHEALCKARLAGVLWAFIGGLIVWAWARDIAGAAAGLLAVAMWATEPMILTHASLVTCDFPGTVTALGASYCFFHCLKKQSRFCVMLAGALLGVALLCKYTNILLVPAWLFAWCVRRLMQNRSGAVAHGVRVRHLFVIAVVSCFLINCGYGFTGSGKQIKTLHFRSDPFKTWLSPLQNTAVGEIICPVPKSFIEGMDVQQLDFDHGSKSYLRGERHDRGWWYFYAYAFCIKTPIGHLLLYLLAAGMALRHRHALCCSLWASPLLIFAVASSKSSFTNNLRYILQVYPFVMVCAAAVLMTPRSQKWARKMIVCGLLICLSFTSVASQYPHMLGYFNESVGGGRNGWFYLSRSNVDWSQDLLRLRAWLAQNENHRPLAVSLTDGPGIDYWIYLGQRHELPSESMQGYAVVDTNALTGDYSWLRNHELVGRVGTSLFVFKVGI